MSRIPSMTAKQKSTLTAFMSKHPELIEGKLTQDFTKEIKQQLWQEVADNLNKEGSYRTPAKWMKTWNDLRAAAKKKEGERICMSKRTGGGPKPKELTPTKKEVLKLMGGNKVVIGDDCVNEMGIDSNVILLDIPSNRKVAPAPVVFGEAEEEDEEVIMMGIDRFGDDDDDSVEENAASAVDQSSVSAMASSATPKRKAEDIATAKKQKNAAKEKPSPYIRDRKKNKRKTVEDIDDDVTTLLKYQKEQTESMKNFTAAITLSLPWCFDHLPPPRPSKFFS